MPVPAHKRFANGFMHIFAGAYAAGYYGYLWAEVLSADAWDAFAAAGVLDQATRDRFPRTVPELGGSRPPPAISWRPCLTYQTQKTRSPRARGFPDC